LAAPFNVALRVRALRDNQGARHASSLSCDVSASAAYGPPRFR
jgi:hypothetical protein